MQSLIKPRILDCGRFVQNTPTLTGLLRLVKDYEMDYSNAARLMELDGQLIPVGPGQVVFRHPGQLVDTSGLLDIHMLTLDYTHATAPIPNIRHCVHPMQPEVHDELLDALPTVFTPRHSMELLALYRQLEAAFVRPGGESECEGLLSEILHLLTADALFERRQQRAPSAVDRAIAYLQEHSRQRVSLDELAAHVHQNKSYLIRCFKKETGLTPVSYLTRIRLSNARRMLALYDRPIGDVARECGFEEASYFTLRFRESYGLSPSEFRKASQKSG